MSVDDALRNGGPWFADYEAVTADGFLDTWGHQEATAHLGPTVDGIVRGPHIDISPHGGGHDAMIRIQEDTFR